MEFEASNVPPNSNMTIPVLPDELIVEILSRLPVKSLLKFRSISKYWFFFISSPKFIKKHINLSANHHLLFLDFGEEKWNSKWNYKECPVISLFYDSVTEALELDYPLRKDRPWLYVKGSCNGLVYLADSYCIEYFLLWNPTTRKYKKLPSFKPTVKEPRVEVGFGYDELHDDYKVVIVSYKDFISKSDGIEVKVYSLKTDSWTKVDYCDEETFFIKTSPGYCRETLIGNGSFVNGKLHWGTSISDMPNGRNIIAFDLSSEKWEKVEKPSYGEEETEMLVGKLGSNLSIFTIYKTNHLGAWVMKEYGVKESWIKMFTIMYPNDEWYPNFFMSNKGEILSMSGATSMIYNSKDDSFRYSDISNCHDGQFGEFYLESLVSPFPAQGTESMEKAHKICPSSQVHM